MKNKIIYSFLILLLGCTNPVDDLEIGDPFSQTEAIVDEWELTRVRHIDNLDLAKPYTDLTSMFTATDASLTVQESSFTYSQNSGPLFLETSGTWSFDEADFPTYFIQNSTTQLKLGSPVRDSDTSMVLILERVCEEKVISSYEYLFIRK